MESFEMWCQRRMEEIIGIDCVKNEVLHRVKEERNILHTIKQRTENWNGHNFRRNCHLKHVIERKIERMERRGRRRKQLLDNLMNREKKPESCKRKLQIYLRGQISLGEFMDLQKDRLRNKWHCRAYTLPSGYVNETERKPILTFILFLNLSKFKRIFIQIFISTDVLQTKLSRKKSEKGQFFVSFCDFFNYAVNTKTPLLRWQKNEHYCEMWQNFTKREIRKKFSEQNLSRFHLVHHKSQEECPGIRHRLSPR